MPLTQAEIDAALSATSFLPDAWGHVDEAGKIHL